MLNDEIIEPKYSCSDNLSGIRELFIDDVKFELDRQCCEFQIKGDNITSRNMCVIKFYGNRIKSLKLDELNFQEILLVTQNKDEILLSECNYHYKFTTGRKKTDFNGIILYVFPKNVEFK